MQLIGRHGDFMTTYKTQVFTEQQLKDLPNGLEVTTVGPVKKGERLVEHYKTKKLEINATIYLDNKKSVCQVGEVVQACNEKGEKAIYCTGPCHSAQTQKDNGDFGYEIQSPQTEECWEGEMNPLLVRLEKIKKDHKQCEHCEGEEGHMEDGEWIDCPYCEGEGGDWHGYYWLKTWKAKE